MNILLYITTLNSLLSIYPIFIFMKKSILIIVGITIIIVAASAFMFNRISTEEQHATCYGNNPCHACSSCKYCGHCAKGGGTCGVCR